MKFIIDRYDITKKLYIIWEIFLTDYAQKAKDPLKPSKKSNLPFVISVEKINCMKF
jgi:hypothetical protein